MKKISLLLICLGSLSLLAQEKQHAVKLLAGINFSPDYAYRTKKNQDGGALYQQLIDQYAKYDKARLGYTLGLNLQVQFSNRLSIATGIQLANYGYKTKDLVMDYPLPAPNSPSKGSFTYAYQYAGIPLTLRLTTGKGKVHIVPAAGLMLGFLVNANITSSYTYPDGHSTISTSSQNDQYRHVALSSLISLGFDYKVNQKMHVLAEPTFRYGLINTADRPITENLWSAGLNFGLFYELK